MIHEDELHVVMVNPGDKSKLAEASDRLLWSIHSPPKCFMILRDQRSYKEDRWILKRNGKMFRIDFKWNNVEGLPDEIPRQLMGGFHLEYSQGDLNPC